MDFFTISHGFHQQTASAVTLILGDQFTAVVAELGFLQQLAVEVVLVGGAAAVEAGFSLDQAIAVVVEVVVLAALVFDLGEQQACVVVAITQLAAIRVDAAADQMQVVGVFVTGNAAQFVALGGDFAVGVVGERAGGAAGQGDLCQAVGYAF
ncbi:hypothetical protein GIW78_19030 [Pseudomonas syringae]|nr:hypothetical protein [Pseudomonas syringae]